METADVLAIIGGIGGVQGVIELVKWWRRRKVQERHDIADVEVKEFHLLQETNEFLQKQLQAKEERFVEQTERLRKTQDELFKAKADEYEARLELVQKKCEDRLCPFRKPPNADTPPKPGLTKEQYHADKLLDN